MGPWQLIWLQLRIALAAILIAAASAWIVAAEVTRPKLAYFPADQTGIEQFAAAREQAGLAANIGMVRGDLLTTVASTETAFAIRSGSLRAARGPDGEAARLAIAQAVAAAPHDARNWLNLAATSTDAAPALKLSDHTGPNALELAPLRLLVAGQLVLDDELQPLVQHDVEQIVQHRPELKPAIARAYKTALPAARRVIETTLAQADPKFLATLR